MMRGWSEDVACGDAGAMQEGIIVDAVKLNKQDAASIPRS